MRRAPLAALAVASLCSAASLAPLCWPGDAGAKSVAAMSFDITLERAGKAKRFVQLRYTPRYGAANAVVGCQTAKINARCTRKRTRVRLTNAQRRRLEAMWDHANKPRPCRHTPKMTRRMKSWQRIIVSGFLGWKARYPAKGLVPKGACFARANFARYLLDRYLRR